MTSNQRFSPTALLLRSFMPSAASAFFCVLAAVILVATNIVLQSVDIGTSLPGLLDGQWSIAYTQYVVQPLTELLSSEKLNKALVAALWGLAGFVIYVGFEYAIHTARNLRESHENIRMGRGGTIERPLIASFWRAMAWRFGVILGGIIFLAIFHPLLGDALAISGKVLLDADLVKSSLLVARAVVEWTFMLHGLVVFLRLYTQRTRLFGDDALY